MRNVLVITIAQLALFAGAASAQKPEGPEFLMAYQADGSPGGNVDEPAGVPDLLITLDITGIEHFDGLDDPDNTVLVELFSPDCVMTGIGWDVTLTTVGASWLSEAVAYFDGVDLDGMGLFLTVGVGDTMPGTATYSSGGILDLTDNGIANIPLAPDGELYIQFYESFVDNPDAPDSTYLPISTYDIAGVNCFVECLPGSACDPNEIPTLGTLGLAVLLLSLAGAGLFLLGRQLPGNP